MCIVNFFAPLLLLLLTGPVAIDVYLLISRRFRPLFWVLWGMLLLFTGIFAAYYFSDFFPGPGCLLSAVSFPMVAVTYFWARYRWRKRTKDQVASQRMPRGLLVISLMQISILVIAIGFTANCNARNRRAAQPVITALEAYRADHGDYPATRTLDELIPQYLAAPPKTACALPAALRWDEWYTLEGEYTLTWILYDCDKNGIRLLVPMMGSQSRQIYNPATRQWIAGDGFDGYCR
jgi:hypothetical protein